MRTALTAVLAVSLVTPVAADDKPATLSDLLRKLEAQDKYGAIILALDLSRCTRDAAKASAARKEPSLYETGWTPSRARPTVVQEIAQAAASCSAEADALAEAVKPAMIEQIKAAIMRDATEAFGVARAERDREMGIQYAPDWVPADKR